MAPSCQRKEDIVRNFVSNRLLKMIWINLIFIVGTQSAFFAFGLCASLYLSFFGATEHQSSFAFVLIFLVGCVFCGSSIVLRQLTERKFLQKLERERRIVDYAKSKNGRAIGLLEFAFACTLTVSETLHVLNRLLAKGAGQISVNSKGEVEYAFPELSVQRLIVPNMPAENSNLNDIKKTVFRNLLLLFGSQLALFSLCVMVYMVETLYGVKDERTGVGTAFVLFFGWIFCGVIIVKDLRSKRKFFQELNRERLIIAFAMLEKRHRIALSEFSLHCCLSVDEAMVALEKLVKDGACTSDMSPECDLTYSFPSFCCFQSFE